MSNWIVRDRSGYFGPFVSRLGAEHYRNSSGTGGVVVELAKPEAVYDSYRHTVWASWYPGQDLPLGFKLWKEEPPAAMRGGYRRQKLLVVEHTPSPRDLALAKLTEVDKAALGIL